MKYYAVKKGKIPGVYDSWEECKIQVHNFSGAIYKSFTSKQDALLFINHTEEIKIIDKEEEEIKEFYTDGSCKDKIGGWAFCNGNIEKFGKCNDYPCTNSISELIAVLEVCKYLDENSKAKIFSDSIYVVKTFTIWLNSWKNNGYRKSDGKIPENLELILKIKNTIDKKKLVLLFKHVYSHTGNPNNERVDYLANLGRMN